MSSFGMEANGVLNRGGAGCPHRALIPPKQHEPPYTGGTARRHRTSFRWVLVEQSLVCLFVNGWLRSKPPGCHSSTITPAPTWTDRAGCTRIRQRSMKEKKKKNLPPSNASCMAAWPCWPCHIYYFKARESLVVPECWFEVGAPPPAYPISGLTLYTYHPPTPAAI
ncbi:hypothetical protein LX32DRAFT_258239 [Colletotrichum zoysiae]|uniref:Uncharacterized protein n=1 Tax=Colletotrichum zoysiae TaxID=1216348 RepID=A0AAD9H509_9PEZI|nr:hypothetical protein LX32DRAFT_258239 [Colletotrichum zoysiae]